VIGAVGAVRGVLAVIGTFLFFIGIATLADRGGPGFVGGLWLVGAGAALLAAALLERARYRSTAADPTDQPVGPGGGEPLGALEPRFVSTQEVFIDPTSQHRMRVFIDHRTGERRYRAED
jgi:hypothetical protein